MNQMVTQQNQQPAGQLNQLEARIHHLETQTNRQETQMNQIVTQQNQQPGQSNQLDAQIRLQVAHLENNLNTKLSTYIKKPCNNCLNCLRLHNGYYHIYHGGGSVVLSGVGPRTPPVIDGGCNCNCHQA
ncbi:unnamed protein product [Adineta steineri]|uniref:Uncharacterized protein n=1 Tax=Adineta steineri TaxID=433720 RepID=A0A818QTU5_9BILA|nr:unnamed protein product [Adineta steineri]CAF3646599.1 unnamed protein product [Adineta steineri]